MTGVVIINGCISASVDVFYKRNNLQIHVSVIGDYYVLIM